MTTVPAPTGPTRRRRWPWVVGAVGLLLLVSAGLFAIDGWKLQQAAADLEQHAAAAQDAVSARDAAALSAEVGLLQAAADEFASHSSGPHWTVASWLPWIKDQTVPLQTAGAAVGAVAEGALGPMAETGDLSALEVPPIVDGRIDPMVLEPFRATLAEAAGVLNAQREVLAAVELGSTVGQVREPFLKLEEQLATLGDLVQGAHVAAELLPPMLGADGERSYIVMVQNNAEPRVSGGIPGAVLSMSVNDGRITFDNYVSAESMQSPGEPVAPLTDDELRIFTQRMATYPQDVNFTPEFPRAAELMSAFWERETGDAPSAVVSVDPVALSEMLVGMEPVTVSGITITADNLVEVLLNRVYLEFEDRDEQDLFFAQASAVLFQQLLSGSTSAVAGAETAIEQGRFLLWSPDNAEQDLLATTAIAGDFVADLNALGVFINDGSGSKIGYYVETELAVTDHLCASDASLNRQTLTYTVSHTYADAAEELPDYFSGNGLFVPVAQFHAGVQIVPPAQMGVTQFTQDGEMSLFNSEQLHGRDLATAWIVLLPGETTTLEFELRARERGLVAERIAQTPGPQLNIYTRSVDTVRDDC